MGSRRNATRGKPQKDAKKNGNQNKTLEIIVLVTAILNLIQAVVDLIDQLTGG